MPIYALGAQTPEIHPDAYVHPDAIVIGSVIIGQGSSVWPSAVLRGDDGRIVIGERTSIQDGAVLHTTPWAPTTVGNDCTIGHNAHLEGCIVEDLALVGSGSVVLHHARIGRGAIVGANALVPNRKVIPPLAMALGVPVTVREGAVEEGAAALGAPSYVERAARYRDGLRRID